VELFARLPGPVAKKAGWSGRRLIRQIIAAEELAPIESIALRRTKSPKRPDTRELGEKFGESLCNPLPAFGLRAHWTWQKTAGRGAPGSDAGETTKLRKSDSTRTKHRTAEGLLGA
jgi:hypothetical protein